MERTYKALNLTAPETKRAIARCYKQKRHVRVIDREAGCYAVSSARNRDLEHFVTLMETPNDLILYSCSCEAGLQDMLCCHVMSAATVRAALLALPAYLSVETAIADEQSRTPSPDAISTCANCKRWLPCGCEHPMPCCDICGGVIGYDCYCDERSYLAPAAAEPTAAEMRAHFARQSERDREALSERLADAPRTLREELERAPLVRPNDRGSVLNGYQI